MKLCLSITNKYLHNTQNTNKMVTFSDICKCSCMDIIYHDYNDYILSKKEIGSIYKKLISKKQITVEECEKLIETVKFDFYASTVETYVEKGCYRNSSNIFKSNQLFHNCKNKQERIEHQEYDDYGPIGEPEMSVITCIEGFVEIANDFNDGLFIGPPVIDVVIMTFMLNILENNDVLNLIYNATTPHYEMLLEECFYCISKFCGIFDIFLNKKNDHSRFRNSSIIYKITFHRFKGFEYYFKKIFGYSIIIRDIGIPDEHQQIVNNPDFKNMIYGHPLASHGLCYESMNAIESLYE